MERFVYCRHAGHDGKLKLDAVYKINKKASKVGKERKETYQSETHLTRLEPCCRPWVLRWWC